MTKRPHRIRFLWIAVFILLVAAAMRLSLLQDIPPGLSRDEVRNADIVTFIRRGENALFFRTGYGHEPLYHYYAVPFQALLGDNALSIRLPAVFLGMLLVAATMRWAKRDFGRLTAGVAAFGLAVGWQPVIFSRIGIRPIMEPLMLVGVAWFWGKNSTLAGIFLGLSLYTYTGARVVFAIPLLFALIQAIVWKLEHRNSGSFPRPAGPQSSLIIFTIAVLVYLPLHFTLQADPTLQARVQQLQGPLTALRNGEIQPVLDMSLATLGAISVSGPPRWTYTISGLPLFNWFTAVFVYAGLALALWRIRSPRYTLVSVWLLVGLLPSAITPHAPSMIRIIGTAPILYLLPGLLFAAICGNQKEAPGYRKVAGPFLLILYLLSLTSYTLTNGFVAWPQYQETHLKYQTVLQEMGRHWEENKADSMVVVQSSFEPIEADTLRRNMGYEAAARWVQAGGNVAGAIILPNEGEGLLYIPEYVAPHPDLMNAAGVAEQPSFQSENRPSFTVYPLEYPTRIPIPISPTLFDETISLLGYKIGEQIEGQLQLFTYWRVHSPLPSDLAIFTHLLDAEGALISQHDGLDVTPSTLSGGDMIVQRHLLPLSDPLPAEYTLQVGLYTRGNDRRLTHPGQWMDRVILIPPGS